MNISHNKDTTRFGAYTTIIAAVLMIIGAILKVVSGADLDIALTTGSPSVYLTKLSDVQHILVMNLTFWVVGVFFLGIAGTTLANLCPQKQNLAQLIKLGYYTGVPLAIVSFIAWLSLVVQLSPDASSTEITLFETIGWFISRADWTATILVVGVGPTLISLAGKDDWVPTWLAWGGILTAIAALLTAIAMFTDALTSYGFAIVPIGLLWMIAAGIVLFRRLEEPAEKESL